MAILVITNDTALIIALSKLDHNNLISGQLAQLETHLMKQDEAFAAFKAAHDAKLVELGNSLDNIASDEEAIIAQLSGMTDLSPANQAILDEAVTALGATSAKAQGIADSLPDGPPPPPPPPPVV